MKFDNNVKINETKLLNINEDKFTSTIIIDNDNINYLLWKSTPTVNGIVKNNSDSLILRDGYLNGVFTSKMLNFNTVIVDCSDVNFVIDHHIWKLDKLAVYKFRAPSNLNVLKRTDKKTLIDFNRRAIMNNYASGKTLIVSSLHVYINDFLYDHSKDCNVDLSSYDTIIADAELINQDLEKLNKKLLIFSKDFDGKTNLWNFKDAGNKTFIFLVGPIGSGKSGMIKKIRSRFPTSNGVYIAQIDKLLESDLVYILSPNEETYYKLRKTIYNDDVDQLIGQAIVNDMSIILETTNVNTDYVKWLKTHKYTVVIVIIDETYENISQNIAIRNQTKIRKTHLTRIQYDEFYKNINTVCADEVIRVKPDNT